MGCRVEARFVILNEYFCNHTKDTAKECSYRKVWGPDRFCEYFCSNGGFCSNHEAQNEAYKKEFKTERGNS